MSRASLCSACMIGDHQHHERDWGIRPGLIGGTYCDCIGTCADDASDRMDAFFAALGPAAAPRADCEDQP